MDISDYDSLLRAARAQSQPQRLLFVFLKATLPKDHGAVEASRFATGQGGALEPIMCVDKTPDELGSFADLVKESEQMNQEWHVVLVASLGGKNGKAPSAQDAERPLKMMMHSVEHGSDLSRYMAFDRQGNPLQFGF